jgi:hypothetical protein
MGGAGNSDDSLSLLMANRAWKIWINANAYQLEERNLARALLRWKIRLKGLHPYCSFSGNVSHNELEDSMTTNISTHPRTFMVTGASSGIGRATALLLDEMAFRYLPACERVSTEWLCNLIGADARDFSGSHGI